MCCMYFVRNSHTSPTKESKHIYYKCGFRPVHISFCSPAAHSGVLFRCQHTHLMEISYVYYYFNFGSVCLVHSSFSTLYISYVRLYYVDIVYTNIIWSAHCALLLFFGKCSRMVRVQYYVYSDVVYSCDISTNRGKPRASKSEMDSVDFAVLTGQK